MKKVVVIGGGTGTFVVLSSLRDNKNIHLSALLTMVDDGGSNKVLRDEFGLLPTSGVRLAMVALSNKQTLLRELFTYRFHQGKTIAGMTFGNLFLAAVTDIVGSQKEAIKQTSELLGVRGEILPISYDNVRLVAHLEDGTEIVGEHAIDDPEHDGKLRITKLSTRPKATISQEARKALLEADYIILGPGDFYTNTVSNLVIEGVVDAINKSPSKIIFISNLMTDYGEAYNYTASEFLKDLNKYLPISRVNTILVNSDTNYPPEALKKYEEVSSFPVEDDLDASELTKNMKIVREAILSTRTIEAQKGDPIKRSMIRHDSEKLGKALSEIIEKTSIKD